MGEILPNVSEPQEVVGKIVPNVFWTTEHSCEGMEGLTEGWMGKFRAPEPMCAGVHRGASSELQTRGVQESTKGQEQREEAC